MTNQYSIPPDWRGLCRQLASYLQGRKDREIGWPGEDPGQDLLDHVHALLAQPEPEDDVAQLRAALHATAAQRRAEDDARIAPPQPEPEVVGPSEEELDDLFNEIDQSGEPLSWRAYARAVLARWGRPTPAPSEVLSARPLLERIAALSDCIGEQTVGQVIALADRAAAWLSENPPGKPVAIEPRGCPTPGACSCVELPAPAPAGEVAELVARLRDRQTVPLLEERARAADLLEQRQAAPVPVAVSERLPGPEDCDAEGRCWFYSMRGDWVKVGLPIPYSYTHWLPAHTLPLPSGEVE